MQKWVEQYSNRVPVFPVFIFRAKKAVSHKASVFSVVFEVLYTGKLERKAVAAEGYSFGVCYCAGASLSKVDPDSVTNVIFPPMQAGF